MTQWTHNPFALVGLVRWRHFIFQVMHRRHAATAILATCFNPAQSGNTAARLAQHHCTFALPAAFVAQRTSDASSIAKGRRRGFVALPPTRTGSTVFDSPDDGERISVTGTIYDGHGGEPTVQLFTKQGCTLCDKATDALRSIRGSHPHTLEAVDITDEDKLIWYDKYKYDIPVLHIDGKYWAKHRLTPEVATEGLEAAKAGTFEAQAGEPNAGEIERRQAERQ